MNCRQSPFGKRSIQVWAAAALLGNLCSLPAAQSVDLAWDPSTGPAIVAYNLYYGSQSGNYTNKIAVGNATAATVSNLLDTADYYFVVTALDALGLESEPSNELLVPATPQHLPPTISTPGPQTITVNQSTPALGFTINDPDSPVTSLTLWADSSNPALCPTNNILFGGANQNRTVTLTPLADQTGTVNITLNVSDGTSIVSNSFQLTVLPYSIGSNQFAAGVYNGLFYETDEIRQSSSGFLKLNLASRGTYSGRLQLGAGRYSFSGVFNPRGTATNLILRSALLPLHLELQLGSGSQANELRGRVTDSFWVAPISADRAVFNATTNVAPQSGRYTVVIPGRQQAELPEGHGFGTVRIDGNGTARLVITLGDGAKLSQAARLSGQGLWPVYAALYAGKGSVLSWLSFENQNQSDLGGTLSWIKPADPLARFYRAGFTNTCQTIGSAYHVPTNSLVHILNLSNAELALSGGDLANGFTNRISIGLSSKVTNSSSNRLSMSFALSSGLFSGGVINPSNSQSCSFKGAVLQKANTAYGLWLGTNRSSAVQIFP